VITQGLKSDDIMNAVIAAKLLHAESNNVSYVVDDHHNAERSYGSLGAAIDDFLGCQETTQWWLEFKVRAFDGIALDWEETAVIFNSDLLNSNH
jgi:hypothetical protein